jgi:ribosomal protein L37AE/L43A
MIDCLDYPFKARKIERFFSKPHKCSDCKQKKYIDYYLRLCDECREKFANELLKEIEKK